MRRVISVFNYRVFIDGHKHVALIRSNYPSVRIIKKKGGKRKKSWFRIIPPWRVSNVSESLAFAGTLAQAARVSASTTTGGSERDRDGGPQNKLRHVCRAIKYMSGKSRRRYRLVRTRLWWHTGEEGKEKREQWNGWV